MKNFIIITLVSFFVLGYIGTKLKEKQPPKQIEFYMGETLNVAGIDIKVTEVKEAKKIGKNKSKNTFLQTFVTVKNTKSSNNYLPHTIALLNRQDEKWICLLDNRFKNGIEKTEYIGPGFVLSPGEEIKAQMIFDCDAYLNEKAGPRKSKPADFKLFVKEKDDGGYIFLEPKS